MTKGILCATDFSEASNEALKWSVQMAKQLDLHLTILYTYRLFARNGEAVSMKRKMEEQATQNFRKFENEVLAASGVLYDFKMEVGFVDDRVEAHIKRNKVSFLVMDKEMSAGNKETFEDLISHLEIPLVIIP